MVEAARPTLILPSTSKDPALGGGVAIFYRSTYKVSKIATLPCVKKFEYVCCRLNTGSQDIIVLSVYRPGSQSITSEFFAEFTP